MANSHNERENKVFREEMTKQKDAQAERDFLKDKSIGGAKTPRPTDAYIDQSLGESTNHMEQAQVAGQRTDKRMNQEEALADQQQSLKRSIRAHEENRPLARAKRLAERSKNTPKKNRGDNEIER